MSRKALFTSKRTAFRVIDCVSDCEPETPHRKLLFKLHLTGFVPGEIRQSFYIA